MSSIPDNGPDINALQAALQNDLNQLDASLAVTIAEKQAAMDGFSAAIPTAGTEFDASIAAAAAALGVQSAAVTADHDARQDDIDSASGELAALEPFTDQAAALMLVGDVPDVTVPTGDPPDCSAAQVAGAINGLALDVRTMRTDFLAILNAFNNFLTSGNLGHLQTAGEKLAAFGQKLQDAEVLPFDTEAEKAASVGELQGML